MVKGRLKGLSVYIDVGAGFKAPAQAIASDLVKRGINAETVDLLKAINAGVSDIFWKKSWVFIVSKMPWIMKFFSLTPVEYFVQKVLTVFYMIILGRKTLNWILREEPDFVVSTHFVSSNLILDIVRKYNLPVSVFTYNSEVLSSHISDIYPSVDAFFVASQEGYEKMLKMGQPNETIIKSGFPLDEKYKLEFPPRVQSRINLGLEPNYFTILFSFGGEGIGDISVIEKILEIFSNIQILAVCGRSEGTRKKLEQLKRTYLYNNLYIYGFVSNMPELLNSCDISAGKSGMNLVFESIYMKKPFLVTMAMENEKVTAEFVQKNGFGWYPKTQEEQISILGRCIDEPEYFKKYLDRVKNNQISFDAGIIVDSIKKITFRNKINRLHKVKALYFDLAGTLCDIPIAHQWEAVNSLGIHSVFDYLKSNCGLDLNYDKIEEYSRLFVQKKAELRKEAKKSYTEYPILVQLRMFFDKINFPVHTLTPDQWNQLEFLFIKPELDITVGFKGIRDLISSISQGNSLYLLSNNVSRRLVVEIANKLQIEEFFDDIFVSADCGIRKPDTNFLKYVINKTEIPEVDTVMIGDRLSQDIKMANDTGMLSIFVNIVDHEDNLGVDDIPYYYRINDIMELRSLFEKEIHSKS